ncbi:MAG TPA: transcription-repair coupling factor, partial [Pseudomonadales bacterium]|nr:transcription-repair coupling factor [Pseudomonadales bacterium]
MSPHRAFFKDLAIPTQKNDHRHWGGLNGSALALAIGDAALLHKSLSVVITADNQSALQLADELRFFTNQACEILHFPDWETLPYDQFSPHQDIISQRLKVLHQLPRLKQGILLVPISTLMGRIATTDYVQQTTFVLKAGDVFDLEAWRAQMSQAGYHCVDTVYEHGEFAIRGSIVDVFPTGSSQPFRIELFDNDVETLRLFDPDTQRSLSQVTQIELLPAKEFPLTPAAIAQFRSRWRALFDVDHRLCPLYQDVSEGIAAMGCEYYLPLFFEHCATLVDYFPAATRLFTVGDLAKAAQSFWTEANARYENLRYDSRRPILPPIDIIQSPEQVFSSIKALPRISLHSEVLPLHAGHYNFETRPAAELTVNAHLEQPFKLLADFLAAQATQKTPVLFCVESAGRRESLREQLKKIHVEPKLFTDWANYLVSDACPVALVIAPLSNGVSLLEPPLCIISESQLYGHQVQQHRRRKKDLEAADLAIKNLTELRIGAPVVHIDHGVGRYLGLQGLEIDGQFIEFLALEYANAAKLYVPVSSLHLISRYSGVDADSAPLHKLGSDHWQKEKRKAAEQAYDVAAELLDIYARRAVKQGFAFPEPGLDYEQFAAEFPFEETPDQQNAISATLADMCAPQAMDRLICGDVGFGKTEVAMRATFIASQAHKQVAILVPTTLLAQQHYESFKDRFANWPVKIEVLSRFKTAKEQQTVLQQLEEGKVDIIIGTHKLLQDSIEFKDLGLIIIDEEHRFGVQHKEKLKALRANVDILTLTATPIPRTLNMALSGMRDISLITTAPAKRLSIKTFVRQHDTGTIKDAVLRELMRGGQIYYLHNEVKDIEKTAHELETLVPEARVGIAHGQMRERELEQVMSDFYHKRFNILVCTTIIETGIDVPSANTIIIDRADKLGLAQLHQLRGRVGRSHHQAYAYLLTPPPKTLSADAVKRLDAIAEANTLGAGFTLASHDLEIRGAGELLGEEQSGNIHSIGISLYMEILEQTIAAIKAGKTPNLDRPLKHGAEINLRLPALIPDSYMPDVHGRLILYKRMANASSKTALDELQVEMIDRFGLLPEAIKNLFRITELKLQAERLGISKIDAGERGGFVEFEPETFVDPLKLVKLVQSQPSRFRLEGGTRLKFT